MKTDEISQNLNFPVTKLKPPASGSEGQYSQPIGLFTYSNQLSN